MKKVLLYTIILVTFGLFAPGIALPIGDKFAESLQKTGTEDKEEGSTSELSQGATTTGARGKSSIQSTTGSA